MDEELLELGSRVGEALAARGLQLATAESCTGGWVGQVMTMVPGSSAWYDRGFITYSNRAKQEMLGVLAATLRQDGAVSEATVREMVEGTLARSAAQVALAVSGVAGPGGGSPGRPVGTVCLAWGLVSGARRAVTLQLPGDRDTVRRASVIAALWGVLDLLAKG